VQQAEAQMLAEGGAKPYLPMEGSAAMRSAVQALLFGADHPAVERRPRGHASRPWAPAAACKWAPISIKRWLPDSARVGERPDLGQPPRRCSKARACR
jgi:aromatic-amino-acid transaminase